MWLGELANYRNDFYLHKLMRLLRSSKRIALALLCGTTWISRRSFSRSCKAQTLEPHSNQFEASFTTRRSAFLAAAVSKHDAVIGLTVSLSDLMKHVLAIVLGSTTRFAFRASATAYGARFVLPIWYAASALALDRRIARVGVVGFRRRWIGFLAWHSLLLGPYGDDIRDA